LGVSVLGVYGHYPVDSEWRGEWAWNITAGKLLFTRSFASLSQWLSKSVECETEAQSSRTAYVMTFTVLAGFAKELLVRQFALRGEVFTSN